MFGRFAPFVMILLAGASCALAPRQVESASFSSSGPVVLEWEEPGLIRSRTGEDFVLVLEERLCSTNPSVSYRLTAGPLQPLARVESAAGVIAVADLLRLDAGKGSMFVTSAESQYLWDCMTGVVEASGSTEGESRWRLAIPLDRESGEAAL